jgi:hypothetical protein
LLQLFKDCLQLSHPHVGILAVASVFAGDSVVAGLHAVVDVPDIACVLGVSDVLILLLAFLP